MRRALTGVVLVLSGCAVAILAVIPPAHAEGWAFTRWEYTCTDFSLSLNLAFTSSSHPSAAGLKEVTRKLTEQGQEGWEFMHAEGFMYCFKRPLGAKAP